MDNKTKLNLINGHVYITMAREAYKEKNEEKYEEIRKSATFRKEELGFMGLLYEYVLNDRISYGNIFKGSTFDEEISKYASYLVDIVPYCARSFSPDYTKEEGKAVEFYAYFKEAMRREIISHYAVDKRKEYTAVSMPERAGAALSNLRKYLEAKNITPEELYLKKEEVMKQLSTKYLEITPEVLDALINTLNTARSINAPVCDSDGEDAMDFGEILADTVDNYDGIEVREMFVNIIIEAERLLNERQIKVQEYLAARFTNAVAPFIYEYEMYDDICGYQIISDDVYEKYVNTGETYTAKEIAELKSRSSNPTRVWKTFVASLGEYVTKY